MAYGKETYVAVENDKPTVVALREIAEGKMTKTIMEKMSAEAEGVELTETDDLQE